MGWRNWSYSIKGAIIGLVYSIFSIFATKLLLEQKLPENFLSIILQIITLPFYGAIIAVFWYGHGSIPFIIYILAGVLTVIVFAFIGWIVRKIKTRK